MYLNLDVKLSFIKPIEQIYPIFPLFFLSLSLSLSRFLSLPLSFLFSLPQLLHANYLVQSPERKLRRLGLTPPSPLSLSVSQHALCGLRDPGTQIHPPQCLTLQRPFHLWKRRLIAIRALSGSPHANRSCTVRWGLGGFPGEISDGLADEQLAKSRFQFARTSHAKP